MHAGLMSPFKDDPIHQEMFQPRVRSAIRALLVNRGFAWFTHTTPIVHEHCIRAEGLKPVNPGIIHFPIAVERNGHHYEMLCLAPHPSRQAWTALRLPPPYMRLGVSIDDLPGDVGLDWSFEYNWNLASILHAENPSAAPEAVFVEVMKRSSVLVVYSRIPADRLRVYANGTDLFEPDTWPVLSQTPTTNVGSIG